MNGSQRGLVRKGLLEVVLKHLVFVCFWTAAAVAVAGYERLLSTKQSFGALINNACYRPTADVFDCQKCGLEPDA